MNRTRLVSATRLDEATFWQTTLLGRSLRMFSKDLLPELCLRFDNFGTRCEGLPKIYNAAIESCPDNRNLLFVHDDVFLHDLYLQHRIEEGLGQFNLVGLAGSRHSDLNEPSWGLAFDRQLIPSHWQTSSTIRMSGAVSHYLLKKDLGESPPVPEVWCYGPFPAPCDLLDGLFLAARADLLKDSRVRFDERDAFRFHLYDLDVCRSAGAAGLRLGTWPILVTHGSGGNFDTPEFRTAARAYLDKWKAPRRSEASQEHHDTLPTRSAR